jgi:hypothetical protein
MSNQSVESNQRVEASSRAFDGVRAVALQKVRLRVITIAQTRLTGEALALNKRLRIV